MRQTRLSYIKKQLLVGRRKLVTIPLGITIGLVLLPLAIAAVLGYFAYTRIGDRRTRYFVVAVIAFFGLFTGSAWIAGVTSSDSASATKSQTQAATVTATQITQCADSRNSTKRDVRKTPWTSIKRNKARKASGQLVMDYSDARAMDIAQS